MLRVPSTRFGKSVKRTAFGYMAYGKTSMAGS